MNTLYYGDNLDILRRHIADESVDLVYLDPPFKSDQGYNVLFRNGRANEKRPRSELSRMPCRKPLFGRDGCKRPVGAIRPDRSGAPARVDSRAGIRVGAIPAPAASCLCVSTSGEYEMGGP